MVVYSVVDSSSFYVAEEILAYLWRIGFSNNGKAAIILVANKVDLERSRVIPQEGETRKSRRIFDVKEQRGRCKVFSSPAPLSPRHEIASTSVH